MFGSKKANGLERWGSVGGWMDKTHLTNSAGDWGKKNLGWLGPGGSAWLHRQASIQLGSDDWKNGGGPAVAGGVQSEVDRLKSLAKELADAFWGLGKKPKDWDWNDVWGTMAKHAKEASEGLRLAGLESRKLSESQDRLVRGYAEQMDPGILVREELAKIEAAMLAGKFKSLELYDFAVGAANKKFMPDELKPFKDVGVIEKNSKEDISLKIDRLNDKVKPEEILKEALNKQLVKQEEGIRVAEKILDALLNRSVPGFF